MKRAALILVVLLGAAAPPPAASGPPPAATKPAKHATHAARARHGHVVAHAHRKPAPNATADLLRQDHDANAAPVPNPDIRAPATPESRSASVGPTLFKLKSNYTGDGYTYGSSPQGLDDRRNSTVPGVQVTVPVH